MRDERKCVSRDVLIECRASVRDKRINGCAADGSAFLWNTNPQDNRCAADGSAFLWNTNPQGNGCAADGSAFLWNSNPQDSGSVGVT